VPTLVAKAGRDDARLNRSIDAFVAEARRLRAPVELLVHPTGPHAFDVNRPGARTVAIMRRTLAFFREHLAD
jgi:dienelactone hydrolase